VPSPDSQREERPGVIGGEQPSLINGQLSGASRLDDTAQRVTTAGTPNTVGGTNAAGIRETAKPTEAQGLTEIGAVERSGLPHHELQRQEWSGLEDRVVRPAMARPELQHVIEHLGDRPAISGNLLCEYLSTIADVVESIVDLLQHPGAWLAERVGVPPVVGRLLDAVYSLVRPLVLPLAMKLHLLAEGLRVIGAVACVHALSGCPCGRALLHDFIEVIVRQRLAMLQEEYWNRHLGHGAAG
jgi:hypothetical protein